MLNFKGNKSRTPPVSVRRQLRKEVGFGCPFCGSPYLEYHHFDPTWAQGQLHRPEGMIALCTSHHRQADNGTFTNQQLYKQKRIIRDRFIRGKFEWRRRHFVLLLGGNVVHTVKNILRWDNNPIIWIDYDEDDYETLSMKFANTRGETVYEMIDNDWLVSNNAEDIECPPGGRKLKLSSPNNGINLQILFQSHKMLALEELNRVRELGVPITDNLVICKVTGSISHPFEFSFDNEISLSGMHMSRGIVRNVEDVFVVESSSNPRLTGIGRTTP